MYSLLGLSVPKQTKTSALVETANLKILLGISFGTWTVILLDSLMTRSLWYTYSLTFAKDPLLDK